MVLSAGDRVGPYEIVSAIGAGGMGEVYRAHDPRLRRDVAIKSLPDHFVADPEHVARFRREAQILAALNHPHIGGIYGIEEAHDSMFLILELVDGETLAQRLKAGPLSLPEAVDIARQVADALESAHGKAIIHRDLKPANIALTADGRVKVLDFGLAKVVQPVAAGEMSTTRMAAATRSGVVLGTAAYMSPEQTQGFAVDKRSDVWAFGCVLYEMLTGRVPFAGATIFETAAAVLAQEPSWTALPHPLPARVHWLLRRCLTKDPKRRLQDIADARIELDDALTDRFETRDLVSGADSARFMPGGPRIAWLAAGALLLALVATIVIDPRSRSNGEGRVYRSSIVLPDGLRLAGQPAGRIALSPDGSRLALVASDSMGQTMLWVRRLDAVSAQPLVGTEGAAFPFWSPDSRWVAFLAQGKLKKIDVDGGQPVVLCDATFGATGAWNQDDVILFTPTGESALHRVSASGGTPTPVTVLDTANGDAQHIYPFFLPDGRHFLYLVRGSRSGGVADPRGVYVGSLDGRQPGRLLVQGGSNARYAQGYLVFLRESALMAQPFDLKRLELRGEARHIADNMALVSGAMTGGAGGFAVSTNGVIVYQTGVDMITTELAWFDRSGRQLATLGERADYADVSLSPDNSRLAVSRMDPERGTRNLYLYDLTRGLLERFTSAPGDEFAPAWSRDGERLAFSSRQRTSVDLHQKMASGVGGEDTLLAAGLGRFQGSWSPDGRFLLHVAGGSSISRSDLWVLPLDGSAGPFPFLSSPAVETHGQFSPDGRWIAYSSGESLAQLQVYVSPFPGPGPRVRVSTAGGSFPRWRRDGSELFYLANDNTLTVATISSQGARFSVGSVRPLFQANPRPFSRLDAYPYDVSADGQRVIINTLIGQAPPPPITMVVNWTAGLSR